LELTTDPIPAHHHDIVLQGYRHRIHDFSPPIAPTSTVLALHGFGTTGHSFRHTVAQFVDRNVRLIAPDQLGFGGSEKPVGVYSLDLYTDLTLAAADHFALDKPFLLGHSAGGKVAAATVARFPDRFAGLILVNTGGFSVLAPVLLLADTALFRLADRPFFRKRILKPFKVARTVETPEQWEAFRRIRGNNAALDIDKAGYREAVRAIQIPTLLVWGLKDRLLPKSTPRRVLRDIPHARFVAMPESGHTPFRDQPKLFAENVLQFVEEQLAVSSGDSSN